MELLILQAAGIIGAAAVIVGAGFCTWQLYQLIRTDAACRGLKHPGLWGVIGAGGNQSSGVLLYLIGRRNHPVVSVSPEQKQEMNKRKKKIAIGLIFIAAGAICCIWSFLPIYGLVPAV